MPDFDYFNFYMTHLYGFMDFVNFENLLFQENWAKIDLYMYTVTVVLNGFIPLHFS